MLFGWLGGAVGGVVLFGAMWWVELLTGRRGVTYIIGGILLLLVSRIGIVQGAETVPLVLAVSGAGLAVFGITRWLEWRTARPGLALLILAFVFLALAAFGIVEREWRLSLIAALQAGVLFFQARWKHSAHLESDGHIRQKV